jgi:hypothetical protein
MKFLLVLFAVLLMAAPVLAIGIGFEKAWADASPGWYLRISHTQTYFDARHPSSIDWWWPEAWLIPWVVVKSTEESLVFVSSDIDIRNKPHFLKKNMIPYSNKRVSNCFDDELVFQVSDQEVKIQVTSGSFESSVDKYSFDYSFIACNRITKWELLRKSCGDENFVACLADKFSKKFPFDILFNLPSTQITCPKVSFFGSEFDLCFIYQALRAVKYPIAASLIIKVFLHA